MYECLLWWMAMPALVRIAYSVTPDRRALAELDSQLSSRMRAAEAASYQVMALFELGAIESETMPEPQAAKVPGVEPEQEPASKRS